MLGTHLGTRHIRTATADQFLRIKFLANFGITTRLPAIIGLLALVAHIVGVTIHGQVGDILGVGILDDTLVFQTAKLTCLMKQNNTKLLNICGSETHRINALRLTSCLRPLMGSKISESRSCWMSALQMGHKEKPNVMRGPLQRFSMTALLQW